MGSLIDQLKKPDIPERSERPRCGARTRAGHPCKAPALWIAGAAGPRNGRCRMHGGLSTGPRTPEGRQRCADAARRAMATRLAAEATAAAARAQAEAEAARQRAEEEARQVELRAQEERRIAADEWNRTQPQAQEARARERRTWVPPWER